MKYLIDLCVAIFSLFVCEIFQNTSYFLEDSVEVCKTLFFQAFL